MTIFTIRDPAILGSTWNLADMDFVPAFLLLRRWWWHTSYPGVGAIIACSTKSALATFDYIIVVLVVGFEGVERLEGSRYVGVIYDAVGPASG